jgi:transposase InsO family protein
MNRKKTARIMRKYGIKAEYLKHYKYNNSKRHVEENVRCDLLRRNFNQRGWVTDITYLQLTRNSKKAYLSTILDLETRDIVSYKIEYRNDNKLVIDTVRAAIAKTKDLNGLILHSDQGYQYLSTEYKLICESNGILISMSRKGTPLDNAVIESFHSSLKKETLYNNNIKNLEEYIQLVIEWLYFYNTTRLRQTKK